MTEFKSLNLFVIEIFSDKIIKTVHRNMTGVSNMADQGRIILQFYSVCNLSIALADTEVCNFGKD